MYAKQGTVVKDIAKLQHSPGFNFSLHRTVFLQLCTHRPIRRLKMAAIMAGGGGCSKPAGIGLSGSIWPLWGYPRGT
jgi:hypothetical protein